MKKHMLKGIVVLLALTFLVVPALAKVSLAPNEEGDLLFYPLYYAVEGLETNFSVTNTSPTECAVAKVIVRSHKFSIEVLDFLIYLTPNDVFKATIKYDNGQYVLVCNDDSLLVGNALTGIVDRGDDADGVRFVLTPPSVTCTTLDNISDDSEWMGYITVIEATAFNVNVCSDCTELPDGTYDKDELFNLYWTTGGWPTCADTKNILTGWTELVLPSFDYLVYKPTVLKDYDQDSLLGVGDETILGTGSGGNTLCMLEAVLAKNNLVVPYYVSPADPKATAAFLTFPTKLFRCLTEAPIADSCFFTQNTVSPDYCVEYATDIYNMEELRQGDTHCLRSPCGDEVKKWLCDEVNIIADWALVANPFTEGWTRVSFPEGAVVVNTIFDDTNGENEDHTFTGAPVIGLILELTENGLALMPPAYEFGDVECFGATQVNGAFQLGFSDCD